MRVTFSPCQKECNIMFNLDCRYYTFIKNIYSDHFKKQLIKHIVLQTAGHIIIH